MNFFGFIVLEIPLAYALAIPLGMHSNGVYWAITVSESAIAVAMVTPIPAGPVEREEDLGRILFR